MTKESNAEIKLKKIYPDPSVYEKERLRIIQSDRDMISYMKNKIKWTEKRLSQENSSLQYYKTHLKELHPRRKS
jgi:hypothetical protein